MLSSLEAAVEEAYLHGIGNKSIEVWVFPYHSVVPGVKLSSEFCMGIFYKPSQPPGIGPPYKSSLTQHRARQALSALGQGGKTLKRHSWNYLG